MPGSRLTREDRERIAAGLAEGLDYAKIARRLGRPTSTISREVARNLRTGGYDAAAAHSATLRRRSSGPSRPGTERARFIGHVTTPAAPDGPPGSPGEIAGRDTRALAEFDERFAALMVETGLPRMAARVLAALVTTDAGALTAADLMRRLRVSPASVSKSVAYLEKLDIVRRTPGPARRECYVIDDDVWLHSWLNSARLHAQWSEAAREGAAVYGPQTPAGVRLDRMSRFFGALSEEMTSGLDPAAANDVLTVIAALVHAAAPRTADELATALMWPPHRVKAALDLAEQRPDLADPVTPKATQGHGDDPTYTAAANQDRLTEPQRQALKTNT
jgi:hypothetical protein